MAITGSFLYNKRTVPERKKYGLTLPRAAEIVPGVWDAQM